MGKNQVPERERQFGAILYNLSLPDLLQLRAILLAKMRPPRVWVYANPATCILGVL